MHRQIILTLIAFVCQFSNAQSQFYDSLSHIEIKQAFIDKNHSKLKKLIKKELSNQNPHPLTYQYVNKIITDIDAKFISQLTEGQKEISNFSNEILKLSNLDRNADVYKKFKECTFLDKLPPYVLTQIALSLENQSFNEFEKILKLTLKRHGSYYRILWRTDANGNEGPRIQLWERILSDKFYDDYPAIKTYIAQNYHYLPFIGITNWEDYTRVNAIKEFIKMYPNDAIAYRRLASHLKNLYRYEEARTAYLKSYSLDPLYYNGNSLVDAAACAYYLDLHNEADLDIKAFVSAHFPNANQSEKFLELSAKALSNGNDKTKARKRISEGLKINPNNEDLLSQLANLDYIADRYPQALDTYSKISKPILRQNLYDYNRYLYSLQKVEEFETLYEELELFFRSDDLGSPNIYFRFFDYYNDIDEKEKALELLEKGIEIYPLNAWLLRNKASINNIINNIDIAENAAKESIKLEPNNSWTHNVYKSILKKQNKNIEQEFESLYKKYPYSYLILNELKELKPRNQHKQFLESIDTNFDIVKTRNISIDLKSEESLKYSKYALEKATTRIDSLFHLNMLAYDQNSIVTSKKTDSLVIQEFIQDIEAFNKIGASKEIYHKNMAYLYRSLEMEDASKEQVKKLVQVNPYKRANFSTSIIDFGERSVFKYWRRLLDKNQYDYDNYTDYMRLNVLYGGSNINTMWAHLKCKEVFPNKNCNKSSYNIAMQNLGNPLAKMEDYKISNTIADGTERYIDWYNTSRKKTWFSSIKKITFNKNDNSVIALDENGEESIMIDHPYHSKPILRQKGSVWVKYDYNEKGDLTKINTSAGNFIKLVYGEDNHIIEMESSEEGNFFFEYNSFGKPKRIFSEKDTVSIYYNKLSKEIDSVRSNGGSSTALKITQMFSDLLDYIKKYDVDDIKVVDLKYEALKAQFQEQKNELDYNLELPNSEVIKAYSDYVIYLKDNLKNSYKYAGDAINASNEILGYLDSDLDIKLKEQLVPFSLNIHEVLLKIRRLGVAQNYWDDWIHLQEILEIEKQKQKSLNNYRKAIENAQRTFDDKEIELLKSSEWLPKSDLNNKAFWTSHDLAEIFPEYNLSNTHFDCVLKRKNGDVLISSNKGIALKKNGLWSFLFHDVLNKKLLPNTNLIKIPSKLEFLEIVESENQELYLSSNNGIFRLNNDYTSLERLSSEDANYIGNSNCKLVHANNYLIAYNSSTINILEIDGSKLVLQNSFNINDQDIKAIINPSDYFDSTETASSYIIQTTNSIYNLDLNHSDGTHVIELILKANNIDFATYSNYEGNLYYLDGDKFFKYNYLYKKDKLPIEVYSNIVKNKKIFGLTTVPINNINTVVVITDEGLNIYKNNHFELFKIPFKKGLDEYTNVSFNSESEFGIITKQKLITFSKGNLYYSNETPQKIKHLEDLNITLILNDGNLYYSKNNSILENYINTDDWGTNIKDFDVDKNGNIYFIDTYSVYKLDFSESSIEEPFTINLIFDFMPVETDVSWLSNSSGKAIKVADDGTIWVTTELSVFRYNESMSPTLKEFSYYKNSREFPARTLEVYNLIETFDNEIWVVTSAESWNSYKGVKLTGGLIVYNKQKDIFEFYDEENPVPNFPWFIKSYTKISDDEAILGTSLGFAYHSTGGIKTLRSTENKSYLDIENRHKNLFLGTEGVQFGNMWLFGCAEGIIGYQDGQWMFPDRLNQLLPEYSKYGQWGGNLVNTLAVDHLGRLNVATDIGLMIIDANKISPVDLLMMSQDLNKAIEYHSIDKLQKERDVIVSGLPDNSSSKKTIKEVLILKEKISELKKLKHSFNKNYEIKAAEFKTVNVDSIDYKIKRISNEYSRLLLTLKEKNPVLYQTLKIPPLDIAGIRSKLKEDECVLQYIPLKGKLIIQVVSKQKIILKEVNVKKIELFGLALIASDIMSNRKEIRGGTLIISNNEKESTLELVLQQLFNHLLSPVINDLKPYKNKIQIITEGALNYIPFEALIYMDAKDKKHHAIEDYNFTYLSSLYMYQLLLTLQNSNEDSMLIMGDPDNSLPHAREEVQSIATTISPVIKPLIGKKATLKEFKDQSKNKDIIHLATHGFLDKKSVKDSWLLFADTKLKLSEVYEFNLDDTDLMILSACETSLGKEGIETTTLSRAFANSGVQNLIASLWRVNDESTKILMTKFYDELKKGETYMNALKNAKLHLINYNNGQFKNPMYWAPFILFGKS